MPDPRQLNHKFTNNPTEALQGAFDLVPIDVNDGDQEFEYLARGIHASADGNIEIKTEAGNNRVIPVKGGMYYPYYHTAIIQAGTDVAGFSIV